MRTVSWPGEVVGGRHLIVALAAVAAGGLAVTGAFVLFAGLPVAWLLLAVCAAATLPVLVWAVWERRYFEPLPVIAAACFLLFVLRPLQLFTNATDLVSYLHSTSTLDRLLHVENQEVSAWATVKLRAPLEPALTRAIGACALFLVVFLVGYCLGFGERAARWLSVRGRERPRIDVRLAVGASLAIAVAAEIVVVARAGGPVESIKTAADQTAGGSLLLNVLTGFAVAALLIWPAWHRPTSRVEWTGFALCGLQLLGYALIVGSRARIILPLLMLAVVIHYRWRPWRLRELLAAFVALVVLAGLALAIREGAKRESLGETLSNAPSYAVNFRAVLSDSNVFDHVLYATYLRPESLPYKHGQVLLDAFRSYVPGFVDPHKPPGGDIVFRKGGLGHRVRGRSPTDDGRRPLQRLRLLRHSRRRAACGNPRPSPARPPPRRALAGSRVPRGFLCAVASPAVRVRHVDLLGRPGLLPDVRATARSGHLRFRPRATEPARDHAGAGRAD